MRPTHSLAAAAVAMAAALGVPATATAEPGPFDTPSAQQWLEQEAFAGPYAAGSLLDEA